MTELTHDRCSELLEAYASGSLPTPARDEVSQHLEGCLDCTLELRGIEALRAPEIVPMTGPEREALIRSVRSAVFAPPKLGLLERFGKRLAPALGAVALLAIGAIALVSMPDDGATPTAEQGGDATTVGDQGTGSDAAAESDAAVPAGAPAARQNTQKLSTGAADSGAGSGSSEDMTMESSAGTALPSRSRFVLASDTFAATGPDLGVLVPDRLPNRRVAEQLAFYAPNDDVAAIVRECVELTVSTSPHPLVASSAVYYPDNVLVIGFVWMEPSGRNLNYELRGWIDGRCDRVSPIYRRGVLE